MKLRLLDVMFRPWKVSRDMIKLLQNIELQPVLKVADRPKADVSKEYVVLYGTVLMPTAVFNMIEPSLTAVDYKYGGNTHQYTRKENQELTVREVTLEEVAAMLVYERMSK